MNSNFIDTAALIATALVVICLHRYLVIAYVIAIVITLAGWMLIIPATARGVEQYRVDLHKRAAAGEHVTDREWDSDGTGDNVAALVTGWFPGALGTGIGTGIAIPLRRRRRQPT
jgi:hypothetical protein